MNNIALAVHNGHATTTSIQVAEHFGKRHTDVLRAIDKLDCSDEFRRRNFASAEYLDEQRKPRKNFAMTRDGFAFLCMGFTGKEAAAWKERYIAAFNDMEARLRAHEAAIQTQLIAELREKASHVLPIPGVKKRARDGLRAREMLILRAQSAETLAKLLAATHPAQRLNLWYLLKQVNNALGIPTQPLAEIDATPPALPTRGEG